MFGTEKYKSKKYDIFVARDRIISFSLALLIIIPLIYLVYQAFLGKYWWSPIASIAGSFVIILLLVVLAASPLTISMHFDPGKKLILSEQVSGPIRVSDYSQDVVENPRIRLMGEGIEVQIIQPGGNDTETTWEISCFFTAFNEADRRIHLYDMHVRSYCLLTTLFPDYSMTLKGREKLTLSSDNSILHEGKTFDIDPGDNQPLSLSLQISRDPADEWTLAVFGIFTDFNEIQGSGAICFPVDCVFCFLHLPPHLSRDGRSETSVFFVNSSNICRYWEMYYLDPPWRRVMKIIDASLEEQLAGLRRHV